MWMCFNNIHSFPLYWGSQILYFSMCCAVCVYMLLQYVHFRWCPSRKVLLQCWFSEWMLWMVFLGMIYFVMLSTIVWFFNVASFVILLTFFDDFWTRWIKWRFREKEDYFIWILIKLWIIHTANCIFIWRYIYNKPYNSQIKANT